MTHISPAVSLVWSLLSILLGSFLVFHLWSFDRFRCLRWDHGPHSGAFKRIMTYSYLLSVPLLNIYASGFAIIKYIYGYTFIPGEGIVPTPNELWSQTAQNAILPLYLSFSIAWGLEVVTHLEELCFWLFIVNSSSAHQDWFRSLYFKVWAVGSCLAVVGIPLITVVTRGDVHKCEASTFLAGGVSSFLVTIWFLPVLWTFSTFIEKLKQQGVETSTLVRLTTYHEMNCIHVVFRFLFTISCVILGVDGARSQQHINDKMFPTDLLSILAGIGCIVSSGLTLTIFFPRSVEGEMALREQQRARRKHRAQRNVSRSKGVYTIPGSADPSYINVTLPKTDPDQLDGQLPGTQPNANLSSAGLPAYDAVGPRGLDRLPSKKAMLEDMDGLGSFWLQPNRLTQAGHVELGTVLSGSEVEFGRSRSTHVSSLVHHWRSPIEIGRPKVSRWQAQG